MLQNPNQYFDFRAQLRKKMTQDGQAKAKIRAAFDAVFDQTLVESGVVLSRVEKACLSRQLLLDLLTELINENSESHG